MTLSELNGIAQRLNQISSALDAAKLLRKNLEDPSVLAWPTFRRDKGGTTVHVGLSDYDLFFGMQDVLKPVVLIALGTAEKRLRDEATALGAKLPDGVTL